MPIAVILEFLTTLLTQQGVEMVYPFTCCCGKEPEICVCFGPTGSSTYDQMPNHVDCSLAEGFPGNHNVLESPIELADDELSFFSAKLNLVMV